MTTTHHSDAPVRTPVCSRAPRLGTQEYALYALANRRVSIRPRVMRSGLLAGAVFWEIEYLGGGGGAMWARFAPTLADAMDVVYATRRADRPDALTVWPAPTPPAEEVEMSGVPCVLTDVQFREVLAAGVALWTGLEAVVAGFNGRAVVVPASDVAAFTLPDGTRARRDGEHADGRPRFIKVREGEK